MMSLFIKKIEIEKCVSASGTTGAKRRGVGGRRRMEERERCRDRDIINKVMKRRRDILDKTSLGHTERISVLLQIYLFPLFYLKMQNLLHVKFRIKK